VTRALGWLWRGSLLGLVAFAIFGPLAAAPDFWTAG